MSDTARTGSPSVLGSDITVTGDIHSKGAVRIEGVVEGDVRVRTLTLTQGASIKGGVEADTAAIQGEIQGTLKAREVTLAASARVRGDITHETLSMEAGARFDGASKRRSAAPKPSAQTPAAPAAT